MKTIPIHPTPAMVAAAEEAYMPFGDMELAIKLAILEAPEVEPVAYAVFGEAGLIRIWSATPDWTDAMREKYGDAVTPLYAMRPKA